MKQELDSPTCPRCSEPTTEPGRECRPCRADAIQRETEASVKLYEQLRLMQTSDVWWFK